MNTSANAVVNTNSSLKPVNGVIFCLLNAVLAEWIFESFLGSNAIFVSISRVVIAFFSFYSIHRFAQVALHKYKPNLRDFLCLQLVLFASILLISVGNLLSQALGQYSSSLKVLGQISPEAFYFAIPYAAGVLVVQSVLGLHYSFVFTVSLALILSLYSPEPALFVPYAVVTNLVACLSLTKLRTRSAYLRAGLNIAIVSFPFALVALINVESASFADIIFRVLGALIGGVLCAFLSAGVTPLVEYLGGYVTDIRLIEMATLDHPLLKELSIQAPGTWNHSMVMGMMVESAATAIGANPVLTRVGAYFHDIGKMKKPLYFVENQVPGENRHDKLSPSMSALIIRSHVKDGIELGKEYALPQILIDMIPQHHGTSKIEYFYEKAKKEAEENEESAEVDESLYCYPGPKPQTKEAGLLMLADGVEAAARTLKDPSLDRIQGLVQKIMNKVFTSGQLNECDLTLSDLHQIAKSFTRVLTGIYHQRIAYHEPAEKVHEKTIKEDDDVKAKEVDNHENKIKNEENASNKAKTEDLKRLGLQ
jgi:putative nucleotidyltransferase with HDIG domain